MFSNKFYINRARELLAIFKGTTVDIFGQMGSVDETDIVYRLRKRAEIRRQISSRKSVQEGKPDRLADLLDEAATEIETYRKAIHDL